MARNSQVLQLLLIMSFIDCLHISYYQKFISPPLSLFLHLFSPRLLFLFLSLFILRRRWRREEKWNNFSHLPLLLTSLLRLLFFFSLRLCSLQLPFSVFVEILMVISIVFPNLLLLFIVCNYNFHCY